MRHKEITLKNKSGDKIFIRSWISEKETGVLQIIHGQNENSQRYTEFAQYMARRGISVYVQDLRGHGLSRNKKDGDRVVFAKKRGHEKTVDDIIAVRKYIAKKHKDSPVHLLGHSMGSFLARKLSSMDKGYESYIISATYFGKDLKILPTIALSGAMKKVFGYKHYSKTLVALSTGTRINDMKKRGLIKNSVEWLTSDEAKLDEIRKDEYLKGKFTAGAFNDMLKWVHEVNKDSFIEKLDKNMKTLIISGSDDPLTGYGEYVKLMHRAYLKAGLKQTALTIYPGMRHETLNEKGREKVYEDILSFIKED